MKDKYGVAHIATAMYHVEVVNTKIIRSAIQLHSHIVTSNKPLLNDFTPCTSITLNSSCYIASYNIRVDTSHKVATGMSLSHSIHTLSQLMYSLVKNIVNKTT